MENIFCSLGGGDEIGASCYFVSINGYNFLFDAGVRYTLKRRYPSLSSLAKFESIDTLNDLDAIFLSHSHSDHNGAIPLLASRLIKDKEIMCSEKTKILTKNQLNIVRNNGGLDEYSNFESINIDRSIEMLSNYPLNQKNNKKNFSFTLFHAGHIQGAVMTLLECSGKRVLYTGDFSNIDYPLTPKYQIPKIKEEIDLLIINSTKLYKKSLKNLHQETYKELNRIIFETFQGTNSIIEVKKLNSGLEIAMFLGHSFKEGAWSNRGIKVYVDPLIWELFQNIDDLKNSIYLESIFKLENNINHQEKNIIITLEGRLNLKAYKINKVSYSLHADLDGIKELIKKVNPKQAFIVHYNKNDLKMNLFKDMKGHTKIKFIENEKKYNF